MSGPPVSVFSSQRGLPLLGISLIALTAATAVGMMLRHGVGLTPDSSLVLSAAQALQRGQGFVTTIGGTPEPI